MNIRDDDAQQRAIRLYNELARIRRVAERTPRWERSELESRAAEIGRELRTILDEHFQVPA